MRSAVLVVRVKLAVDVLPRRQHLRRVDLDGNRGRIEDADDELDEQVRCRAGADVRHRLHGSSYPLYPSCTGSVASPAAMPTEEYAGDVVLDAGMAKILFPVGPNHEAIRLAHFTTTNRAWAIPAIPSGFHASTETVPIKFQHGAHNNLSVSVRCLILLSTYFIYFFIRMDRWTDMYVDLYM